MWNIAPRSRMRYSAFEKLEIIRLVEQSHLPARRTLEKLGILPCSFIAGSTAIKPAGSKLWKTSHQSHRASGTAFPTTCAGRSLKWPSISRTSRLTNSQPGSRIRRASSSEKHQFTGCSKPTKEVLGFLQSSLALPRSTLSTRTVLVCGRLVSPLQFPTLVAEGASKYAPGKNN